MDRRCYEELLDERKNMELTYEERIAQLQDQHAEVRLSFLVSYLRLSSILSCLVFSTSLGVKQTLSTRSYHMRLSLDVFDTIGFVGLCRVVLQFDGGLVICMLRYA